MNPIKTIDINAKEWFDKVNGNSYFAGTVTTNYGCEDSGTITMPFQYGYGEYYKDAAFKLLQDKGIIKDAENNSHLWRYCEEKNIVLRTNKQTGCKKRDLMQY